jgi:hypothetical protein
MSRLLPLIGVIVIAGCEARPAVPLPPREVDGKTTTLRDLQSGTAHTAVAAGAKAGQMMIAEMPSPPAASVASNAVGGPNVAATAAVAREVPAKPGPAIRLTAIKSDKPQATREKALSDALEVARYKIMEELQKLDPPVHARPSLATIRHEYLKANTVREVMPGDDVKAKWKLENLDPNRQWVTIDIELTDSQVQSLRASDRVTDGIRMAAAMFVAFTALYGFLRIDQLTKGYLTMWLGIGALVTAAMVAYSLMG